MSEGDIVATSDVARDILQNSDYFTSVGKAIAEYVWNSVDYCKPRSRVEVRVSRDHGAIQVRGGRVVRYNGLIVEERKNGGGMSREDLRRFFTMHAETLARKQGRRVRGRFGTGKAAAFGIGKTLIIDTVKSGRRNVVRLSIEDLRPGPHHVPIEALLTDKPTTAENGTTVVIDRLKLRRVKVESLKSYLIRSLGRHLRSHDIYVSGAPLAYSTPEIEKEWTRRCPRVAVDKLGECDLKVCLSKGELSDEERGIAVLSNTYPIEIVSMEKHGSWAERIFGEVDAPLLDSEDPIPTFDNTRSRLNRDNLRVNSLLAWIDESVSDIVKSLEKEARSRLTEKDQEKLRETARDIESLLNEDFAKLMEDVREPPVVSGVGPLPIGTTTTAEGGRVFLASEAGSTAVSPNPEGGAILLDSVTTGGGPVERSPDEPVVVVESADGDRASPVHVQARRSKLKGGFKLVYVREGVDAPRATYVPETMEIRINLDHPELAVHKSFEDPVFKSFCAEIAISEYSVATVVARFRLGAASEVDTVEGALGEVRKTVNRLGRMIAPLLSKWLSGEPT